jgi:GTP:adenosylcobinamide-phosphate guanylyltransferase
MFDVVILAGAGRQSELTLAENVENKAWIEIGGRPMLAYVLEALQKTGVVGRIAVVGPAAALAPLMEDYGIIAVAEGDTIPENLSRGVAALAPRSHFLIASADIPFLTAEAVLDFLQCCKPYSHDVYYPIVSREDNDRRFPGVTRTYVRLRDGVFTGGNIFLASPAGVETALPRLERFFALRKSPLKLAASLGPIFVLKLLTRRLTLAELETHFSSLFGLKGKAVYSSYAEIGTDVDKPSDLALARAEMDSSK